MIKLLSRFNRAIYFTDGRIKEERKKTMISITCCYSMYGKCFFKRHHKFEA